MVKDHYPVFKWLFHWEYTQHFQTNPYIYICICDFVEDHKGRESSNSFGVFRGPPNHNQSPLQDPTDPLGLLLHFSICGADHSECPHSVFSHLAALSHVKRIHANVEGWNAYASGSDHPRWVISSGKIHTGIFFFWMSTPYRLSFIKCCFWQRNPLCRDLAV